MNKEDKNIVMWACVVLSIMSIPWWIGIYTIMHWILDK